MVHLLLYGFNDAIGRSRGVSDDVATTADEPKPRAPGADALEPPKLPKDVGRAAGAVYAAGAGGGGAISGGA